MQRGYLESTPGESPMRLKRSPLPVVFGMLALQFCGGCAVLGAVAGKAIPAPTIHPKYVGLPGQSIGVMVWTDRGAQVDYPSLGLDLANSVEKKLIAENKTVELKGSFFPVQPASIARYQVDHPNYDFKNVTEIAPKLGVTRLIYLEVEDFGTRAAASVELFRGSMTTTLKVVEIDGNNARVAYEENGIKAVFPPKVQPDGTPDGDDVRFYAGTVDAMSTEIAHRLVSYQEEDE
jgi:hypothetical protein